MQYIEKTTQICSIIQYKHEIAYLIGLGDEGGGVKAGNRRKWRKKIERKSRNRPAEFQKMEKVGFCFAAIEYIVRTIADEIF